MDNQIRSWLETSNTEKIMPAVAAAFGAFSPLGVRTLLGLMRASSPGLRSSNRNFSLATYASFCLVRPQLGKSLVPARGQLFVFCSIGWHSSPGGRPS